MAEEQSRFFDFADDDKEYQADQFSEYFRTFLTDGLPEIEANLQVTAPGTGMLVNVNYGAAIVYGYGYWLKDNETSLKSLFISGSDASYTRIDRLVLRLEDRKSVV